MRVLRLPKVGEVAPIPESCPVLAEKFMEQGVDAQFAAFSGHLWLRWISYPLIRWTPLLSRISVNVYNCREDYIRLKEELLQFFSL